MATYDNKHWLLSNIRNSFISTDDTGMCEIVMAGENFPKQLYSRALDEKNKLKESTPTRTIGSDVHIEEVPPKEVVTEYDPYPEMEESDDDMDLMNGSYIRYEDFGPHRQRSNTAQWLDKKEQAMKKAAKIKVIKWENPTVQLTEEEREQIFVKKDLTIISQAENRSKKKSLLTDQLEKCPHLPHSQYLEYARFDGTAQLGLPTKTFKIFMTMLPEKHQNYPIIVCVIANAKIQDLIGFTCYKYSIDHPDISLGSANTYGLCIAEDDGEVDWTFPCLDANEPCSKFGFTCLGLVNLKVKNLDPHRPCSMPEGVEVEGLSTEFQMIYPKGTESNHNPYGSRNYTGGSATSEAVLFAIQSVNNDKKNVSSERDQDLDKINSHILATEAPQYKAYRVQLSNKVRANTSVQIGISLERIEIEPLQTGSHKFWARTKYLSYSIDSVAWCQVVEMKASKTLFRLVYSQSHSSSYKERGSAGFHHPSASFKHHDFECDHETAKEIVEKVNRILDLRNSPCRREYKTAKEKKTQMRRSFQNQKHLSCS